MSTVNLKGNVAEDLPVLSGSLQSDTQVLTGTLQGEETVGGHLANTTLQGYSAYEIAVKHGYTGTEEEWLADLKNYEKLDNQPKINGTTVVGDKTFEDFGLSELSSKEVSDIFNSIFY